MIGDSRRLMSAKRNGGALLRFMLRKQPNLDGTDEPSLSYFCAQQIDTCEWSRSVFSRVLSLHNGCRRPLDSLLGGSQHNQGDTDDHEGRYIA